MFKFNHLREAKENFCTDLGVPSLQLASEKSILQKKSLQKLNLSEREILYADSFNEQLNSYHTLHRFSNNMAKIVKLKSDEIEPLEKNDILKYFSSNEDNKLFYTKHLAFSSEALSSVHDATAPETELRGALLYQEIENFLYDSKNPYLRKLAKKVDFVSVLNKMSSLSNLSKEHALGILDSTISEHLEQIDNFLILSSGDIGESVEISVLARDVKDSLNEQNSSSEEESKLSNTSSSSDDENTTNTLQ